MNGNVFKSPKIVRLFFGEVRKAKYSNFVEKTRPIYFFNSQIFGRGSEIARFETAEKKSADFLDEVHEWTSF